MSKKNKKIKVNRKDNFRQKENEFDVRSFANRLLLQSGFEEGTQAYVSHNNGRVIIRLNKKYRDYENN